MIKFLMKQDMIFLTVFPHSYSFDSDEPCQNINVTIKNVALEAHQGVEGAYELNDYEINEKPSWKLISDIPPFWNVSYIWYIPQFEKWAVGPSDHLGSKTPRALQNKFENDPELPYNIKEWEYYFEGIGWIQDDVSDVKIECTDILDENGKIFNCFCKYYQKEHY